MERAEAKAAPEISQAIMAIRAMAITMGTKTPLTLSASFEIGAFDDEASSTSAMICERVEFSAVFLQTALAYPEVQIVPAITVSDFSLENGNTFTGYCGLINTA